MRSLTVILGLTLVAALSGCRSVDMLAEPEARPEFVTDYTIAALRGKVRDLPVAVNVSECLPFAAFSSDGFFGTPSIVGTLPVRPLIEREFVRAVEANSRRPRYGEEPKIELIVETELFKLRRSYSMVSCEIRLAVRILTVSDSAKTYFNRRYEVKCESRHKQRDEIPPCVYETIQKIVRQFLDDISADGLLTGRLDRLNS